MTSAAPLRGTVWLTASCRNCHDEIKALDRPGRRFWVHADTVAPECDPDAQAVARVDRDSWVDELAYQDRQIGVEIPDDVEPDLTYVRPSNLQYPRVSSDHPL